MADAEYKIKDGRLELVTIREDLELVTIRENDTSIHIDGDEFANMVAHVKSVANDFNEQCYEANVRMFMIAPTDSDIGKGSAP